ncbi:MAG: ATP-binding cassette domain-containing protein [Gammaproteobacteria bacterium]|nr:ATP-binding cassette domain-containing protein [Gammaproteobacteria bacterium]
MHPQGFSSSRSGSNSRALIEIAGVDVVVAGATLLHDVTWRLAPGEHWGVVGANGSGKSTLLALLSGARWPAPGRGWRTYDFGDGPQRDAIDARREITLVGHELQDRYARLGWNFSAIDVVLSGVFRSDTPRKRPATAESLRARSILRDLRLDHLAERPFLELSRGEQRRVLIARSLAFRPQVLLLDEPASGLDAAARRALHDMLARAAERAQLIVTGHAVEDIPGIATHIVEIAGGRIVTSGPAADARAGQRAAEAREGSLPGVGTHRHATPAGPSARRRRADAASNDEDVAPATYAASKHEDVGPAADAAPPLIEIRNADAWLGGRRVLHGIDWRLREGQHWLVTGANGAGKSSFLRMLHGQLRPSVGGSVSWPGLGDPRSVWTLRRTVAWVSPELQAGYRYRATVHDCIASGFDSSLGLVRPLRPEERERVAVLLERFDLASLAARKLTELSYGQFRRVLLARALVHRPRVLLLDEPWEGLDRSAGALLAQRLAESVAEGTHLVCATHLAIDAERYTHELVLDRGAVAAAGLRPRDGAGAGPRGSSSSARRPEPDWPRD